jgi:hypothetical protein
MAPPTKYRGKLTARQFNQAAKQANVSPLKMDRARRVLVDGERVQEVDPGWILS